MPTYGYPPLIQFTSTQALVQVCLVIHEREPRWLWYLLVLLFPQNVRYLDDLQHLSDSFTLRVTVCAFLKPRAEDDERVLKTSWAILSKSGVAQAAWYLGPGVPMIHAFELLTKAFCVPDTAIENHLIAASLLVFANFLVFWYNWKGTQMERRASSSASWGTRPGLGDAAGPDSGEIHAQDIGALTIAFRITGKSWPPTGSRTWTEKALAKHRLRGLRSLCFALRWLAKVVEVGAIP